MKNLRNLSDRDEDDIIRHGEWIDSGGLSGVQLEWNAKELRGYCLKNLELTQAILDDCDFSGSNLQGVILDGASLNNANLSNCNLKQSSLIGTILENADLSDADLRMANLTAANIRLANLQRANMLGTITTDIIDEAADMRNVHYDAV